jgi:hypothetical protein
MSEHGPCGSDGPVGPAGPTVSKEEYERIMAIVYSHKPRNPGPPVKFPWVWIGVLWLVIVLGWVF